VNLNLARTRDLKSPPPDIVQRGTAIILTYLRRVGEAIKSGVLDLSCLELYLFPMEVTKIPTITKLNLFQNHLMELPEDLKYLTRLKELNAVRNELRYACQKSPVKELCDTPKRLANVCKPQLPTHRARVPHGAPHALPLVQPAQDDFIRPGQGVCVSV
jgi:hypothetical protein